ncbi:hypothetical protein E4T44_00081 [Aureobasidium sp. EXF-8845]|nr:hypothetical protein E4T44_00081 [Aureobasidium sp. EXF-8845]KAI4858403.1 hypothetical protein E4T45_00080 [Aureobasidium sp. EXF-8846]
MAQSSVTPPSTFRTFYPHMSDSFNDQATSDIVLCFGDNEKVYAHKIILKAASGVWKQAFNSKLPISTQSTYDIEGYSDRVVYAMLRHIYAMSLEANSSVVPKEGQLDYLFDVFIAANEYQIPSLGEAVTQRVVQLMKTYTIEKYWTHRGSYTIETAEGRKSNGAVISKTVELYANNIMADRSLMNGVLDACLARFEDIAGLEEYLHISSLIGKHDPFSGRLLELHSSKANVSFQPLN